MPSNRSLDRARPRLASGAAAILLVALAAGCADEVPERRLDVRPELDLPDSLAFRQPIEIGYRWVPAAGFEPPAEDYKVFLHVVDDQGEIIEQDDHYPPVPTTQWQSGEPVEYSRWLYPSSTDHVESMDFYAGLYRVAGEEQEQIAVRDGEQWSQRPLVHTIDVRADDNRGIPVYVEGFHEMEIDPAGPTARWVWMRREGMVAFGNPRGPAILHFQAHSPVDESGGEPQTIRISIDGRELTTLTVEDSTPFLERIPVPEEMLGDEEWVEMKIEVDSWFVPAQLDPGSSDTRELGLQVYGLYLAPQR